MGNSELLFAFIFGSVFGSFFNVVIYRLPNNISLIEPPSHCPVCKKRLKWYHNIPLLSYIFLKGRCAYCGAKIPFSYFIVFIVEFSTALAFLLLILRDGFTLSYFFDLLIFSVLLMLSFIDFKFMEVPSILNDILMVGGLMYLILNYSLHGVIFSILVAVFFLVLYFFYKDKLGMGDVKIFIALSMFFGYDLIYVVLISSLLGLFAGLIIAIRKKAKFSSLQLPFVPFIFSGVVIYWLILYFLRISTLLDLNI